MGVDIMYSEATEDVFFDDDLRKRILLLTADDEDGFTPTNLESGYMECWKHLKTGPSLMRKGSVFGIPPLITVQPDKPNIWSWDWEVPQNKCKGTGVFIPRQQKCRRKSKAGPAGKTRTPMKS